MMLFYYYISAFHIIFSRRYVVAATASLVDTIELSFDR